MSVPGISRIYQGTHGGPKSMPIGHARDGVPAVIQVIGRACHDLDVIDTVARTGATLSEA